ncbi:MAG: uroporphyrinogen-III synthase [Comamonas sp.]|nr:uroporphyrinogen-III synthase [Comamonas sp.]
MRPIVVTRPQPEATVWVQQLQAEGHIAACVPMMEIRSTQNAVAQANVQAALNQLHGYSALMFVSGNAVRYFMQRLNEQSLSLNPASRLWAPGPGTAQALLTAGFTAANIDQPRQDAEQFDSEALWNQVQQQVHAHSRILIVRGSTPEPESSPTGHGRQWLSEQLRHRGAKVDFAPVYERSAPEATLALQQAICQLRTQSAIWLFSSSECLQNLVSCAKQSSWKNHTALVTHPRIAEQARKQGFGCVIDTKPTLHAVAASIKSLHDL